MLTVLHVLLQDDNPEPKKHVVSDSKSSMTKVSLTEKSEKLRSDGDRYPLIWALIKCEKAALLCSVCEFSQYKCSHHGSVHPSSDISLDQSWEETQLLMNLHYLALPDRMGHEVLVSASRVPIRQSLSPQIFFCASVPVLSRVLISTAPCDRSFEHLLMNTYPDGESSEGMAGNLRGES